jgi:hypothetical protein
MLHSYLEPLSLVPGEGIGKAGHPHDASFYGWCFTTGAGQLIA